MRSHIDLLLSDLHQRVLNLQNLLVSLGSYGQDRTLRLKRAPLEFVGTLANYLFGIVDHTSFAEAQAVISQLEELSETERKTLNLHGKILNLTASHIKNLEDNQSKTHQAIASLDSNVKILDTAIRSVERQVFDVSNALSMVSSITYAASAVTDLAYTFTQFSDGLNMMTKGQLSPILFPADRLTSILDEINHSNSRTLWPSAPEFLPLYYKFTQIIPLNYQSFLFLIMIPLLPNPSAELNLFKLEILPYPLSHTARSALS